MTYASGQLIEATDYNGFANNTAGANVNSVWATGTGDAGYGQTALSTVSVGTDVTATQWANLNNRISSLASQTNTTITSRTNPVVGATIGILSALDTDLTNVTTNRGNASVIGTQYGVFTSPSSNTSKTTGTGSGTSAWTITFTHTVTFPSAAQARYFWNAGGIVRLQFGKSSTGTDSDPDWNTFAGKCGSINLTGRVNNATQTIAGQAYTGTTRLGGTGGTQTILATTTGWYNLSTTPTIIFQLNNDVSPYSGEYIRVTAAATSSTVLTLVTTWVSDGSVGPGTSANISGGTGQTSPATSITVDAPTTLCTYFPPSTTYLTNSWGTPSIAASVA